jgi:hypothetical protein
MKALSLTQPMAWAIFHGKDVENRTWQTHYRGRVMIHGSLKFNYQHYRWIVDNENRLVTNIPEVICNWHGILKHRERRFRFPKDFVFGAIIGEVSIVDCVRCNTSRWSIAGQWNWILKNAKEYRRPIPCKGHLSFFEPEVANLQTLRENWEVFGLDARKRYDYDFSNYFHGVQECR